jgi:P4 family phage/plasmid primase-like protien
VKNLYKDKWKSYLKLGLIPYPASRNGKNPIVPWKDDLPAPCSDDYAEWEERYPDANIWVLLGNDFIVIDPDGPGAEEFAKSLNLPKCPTSKSGNISIHRWFKVSSPIKPLKIQNGDGTFLEVRTGHMGMLAPPSIHPETKKAYKWMDGHSPWNIRFPELPIEIYERIKALLPKQETKPEPRMMPAHEGNGLGPLDVERYLNHYGIRPTVKQDIGRTLFLFDHCLYENEHTTPSKKGDSSIIQGADGKLGYQCFHNHCAFKTWADARKVISGDDPIIQFCEGYTPPQTKDSISQFNKGNEKTAFILESVNSKSVREEALPAQLAEISDQEKSELLFKDFSDTENARRFLKFNRDTFLWIEDLQRWWHHDPDRPGWGDGEMAVRSSMKETANRINKLALEMPFTDDKQRLEKLKQCIAWKDANGIENSIKMLRDEGFTQSNKFDTNPFLFLCKSGLINLKTGEPATLKPSDYLHKMSPVRLDPEAKYPQWDQFIKDISLNNEELILFIKKFAGYTMTGDTREEKFLILEGPGANGKSTLLEVIAGILGEYAVPIPFATFKDPKWDQGGNAHQADIVQLIGARFIRSVEIKERARLNIERLKSLTGNDEMSARPPYARDNIKFFPVGKIWLAVNHLPKIYDTTLSSWRRILRIPFLYTVPPDKLIKDYSKKLLREESAGILNWMLDGCYIWQREGLEPIPSIVMDATNEYRLESNPIKRFVSEKYEIGKFQCACGDFYSSFLSWWKDEMGEIEPISKIEIGKELKRMEFDTRTIKNVKHYIGLKPKIEIN